jgi:hypothetical protein
MLALCRLDLPLYRDLSESDRAHSLILKLVSSFYQLLLPYLGGKIDNGGSHGGSSGLRHAGEGAASCGDACAAVRLCRVPCSVAAGAQHGHQQARLPRLPEHHRALPAPATRVLPREVLYYVLYLSVLVMDHR